MDDPRTIYGRPTKTMMRKSMINMNNGIRSHILHPLRPVGFRNLDPRGSGVWGGPGG
jgi:hypothetical protein